MSVSARCFSSPASDVASAADGSTRASASACRRVVVSSRLATAASRMAFTRPATRGLSRRAGRASPTALIGRASDRARPRRRRAAARSVGRRPASLRRCGASGFGLGLRLGVDHRGLGICLRARRTRPAPRPWSASARRRRGGRAPRRGRRCPRQRRSPARGLERRGWPNRPRQGRVRPPTEGGSHVSAGSTSFDDSSGRGSPAHSGAGRSGWSWCGRVRGSAPVVPPGAPEVPPCRAPSAGPIRAGATLSAC